MTQLFRVALLGFSPHERTTLAGYFRMAANRVPRYEQVQLLNEADLMVADADHGPSEQLVVVTERLHDTVFVGTRSPTGAMAWLPRPLDPLRVLRELDALVAARGGTGPTTAPRMRTLIQPPRRTQPSTIEAALTRAAPAAPTLPPTLPPALPTARPPGPSPAPASSPSSPQPVATELPEVVELDLPLPLLELSEVLDTPVAAAAVDTAAAAASAAAPPLDMRELPTAPARAPALEPAPDPALHPPELPPLDALPEAALYEEPAEAEAPATPLRPAPPPAPTPSPTPPRQTATPKPPRPAARAVPPVPSPIALLVDDSEIALRFLQTRLARFGISCHCVQASAEALAMLRRLEPDFVFLDMELGEGSDLDGLALARRIKAETATRVPPLPVFMVTAHHGQLDRVRATLAGCDALLGKPLADAELERLLAHHGVQRVVAD